MNNKANVNDVLIKSRKQKFVTCPYCWTDQRTDRDFCYQCGTRFLYIDELGRQDMNQQSLNAYGGA